MFVHSDVWDSCVCRRTSFVVFVAVCRSNASKDIKTFVNGLWISLIFILLSNIFSITHIVSLFFHGFICFATHLRCHPCFHICYYWMCLFPRAKYMYIFNFCVWMITHIKCYLWLRP